MMGDQEHEASMKAHGGIGDCKKDDNDPAALPVTTEQKWS